MLGKKIYILFFMYLGENTCSNHTHDFDIEYRIVKYINMTYRGHTEV